MSNQTKNKIYEGDIGTIIRLNCGTDISEGTVFNIKVRQSNDTELTWVGELDHTDSNYMRYITVEGDLIKGSYKIQAYIETPSWKGRGETTILKVFPKYS